MTLIVSWLGVDTHGPTSAYIAGDSRISWNSRTKFDYGKKVFSSKEYPEILAYSGDVLFPSIVLSQIIEMIDSNILFTKSLNCNERYYIPSEISWLLKSLNFRTIDILGAKLGAFNRNDKLTTEDFEMLVIAGKQ